MLLQDLTRSRDPVAQATVVQMGPEYIIVLMFVAFVVYLGVLKYRGDCCSNCHALLGREIGGKRVMESGRGLEWDIVCSKCGHTDVESEEGLFCSQCEFSTAVVESRYTGINGFELSGIRCLNCGHSWKQEHDYSKP